MEKVKLTQEQADAIEFALTESEDFKDNPDRLFRDRIASNVSFHSELYALNKLDVVKLAKALFIPNGYEVEPEFKVGDWVHDNVTGKVAKIDDRGYDGEVAWVDDDEVNFFTYFRHATPEEIAEEKERRWWGKQGRKPWELKCFDTLKNSKGKIFEVERLKGDRVIEMWATNGNIIGKDFGIDYLKRNFQVVCFAEDRKDVAHAE